MVCRYCAQPRHIEGRCEAKEEVEEYGDYRHDDIAEGRTATPLEKQRQENEVFSDIKVTDTKNSTGTEGMAILTVITAPAATPVTSSNTTSTNDEMDKTAHISQTNNIVIKTSAATKNMSDNGTASPRQEGGNQKDNQSIPEPHTQPLVIGDSLLRDINEPVGVCISFEAGATLSSALNLINKANDNHTGLMNPGNVVIHVRNE